MFATKRGGPFATDAVNRLIKGIGKRPKLPFPVHAHMLSLPRIAKEAFTARAEQNAACHECGL